MMRELTTEQELRLRKEKFDQLKPGTLFNISTASVLGVKPKIRVRYFVAISVYNDYCKAIELHKTNRSKLIKRQVCSKGTCLRYWEMNCFNICS